MTIEYTTTINNMGLCNSSIFPKKRTRYDSYPMIIPNIPDKHSQSSHCGNNEDDPQSLCHSTQSKSYKVLPRIIGHGVAGRVRPAINQQTRELCAVKTIQKTTNLKRRRNILREVELLRKMEHPNIVRMYDVFEQEDAVHIVTEMCHGGDLFDQIVEKAGDTGCFRESEAAMIISSLLSAVSYLHGMDIIHRDIKPENILLTTNAVENGDKCVKLIDFGLSKFHTKSERPLSTVVGTSYYMAPEVLGKCYDRRADMWSVGVLTYLLLSGRPPFNGRTDSDILMKIRSGTFAMSSPVWNFISEKAKDFVKCLMKFEQNERLTAMEALDHPWLRFFNNVEQ